MPDTSLAQQQQEHPPPPLSSSAMSSTGSDHHLSDDGIISSLSSPSPSNTMAAILMDTNISPNPVVITTTTNNNNNNNMNIVGTTKRVEFNFVPSMRMFDENDEHSKIDNEDNNTNDNHDDDPIQQTSSSTTLTTSTTNNHHHNGGAVLWDTETDHMLSYFLSGNDQGPSSTNIDFTTMPSAASQSTPTPSTITTTTTTTTTAAATTTTKSSIRDHTTFSHRSNNDILPPPTPVVHFYSNTQTPLSSNVYARTGNTGTRSQQEQHISQPKNDVLTVNSTSSSTNSITQVPAQQVYPAWSSSQQLPPMTGNGNASTSTTTTTATQSQSSSSSSLSSLANHQQIQMYHQQLQMQRLLAGSGGGGGGSGGSGNHHNSSNGNNNTMYYSISQQQQQQPSPPFLNYNTAYPQMVHFPPILQSSSSYSSSNNNIGVGGDSQQQQQQPTSLNLLDGESPLSPAAMIGTPSQHENLFLPRSNSFYENTSKKNNPLDINITAGDNNSTDTVIMGPPVSRQPSQNDILSVMASTTMATTGPGSLVWPPPGTTTIASTSPSMMSSSSPYHHPMTTAIPYHHMMAPFLPNPLSTNTTVAPSSSSNDPMNYNNMPSLLPNLQPYMYTTNNNMMPQHEPSSMSSSSNNMIPSVSSSQSPIPPTTNTQPSIMMSEEESEEKRNKRLERNRESARKCRLKKKERLYTLGIQVTELHKRIEGVRRTIINNMVPILMQKRRQHEILNYNNDNNNGGTPSDSYYTYHDNKSNNNSKNPLTEIIRGSGPSSTMMRSVLEFQYSTLKDITLPHYEKLILWFTIQKESYYTMGKEQYYIEQQKKIKQQQQKQQQESSSSSPPPNSNESNEKVASLVTVADSSTTTATTSSNNSAFSTTTSIRPNAIKMSSKQIGEELMTGISSSSLSTDDTPSKKRSSKSNIGTTTSAGITSSAVYDGAKTWPLFCYEMKLSVDQEERFVGRHKQINFEEDRHIKSNVNGVPDSKYRSLSYLREQMAVAVTTTEHLGKAVGTLSHMIAQRDENTYLNVLHPPQVSKYYQWLSQHRAMVRQMMPQHKTDMMEHITTDQTPPPTLPLTIDMDTDPSTTSSLSLPASTVAPYDGNVPCDATSLHTISRRLSEVLQISSRK